MRPMQPRPAPPQPQQAPRRAPRAPRALPAWLLGPLATLSWTDNLEYGYGYDVASGFAAMPDSAPTAATAVLYMIISYIAVIWLAVALLAVWAVLSDEHQEDAGGKPSEPEVPAGHELLQARIRSTRGAATSSSDLSDAELDAELAGIHSSANAKQLLSLQAAKHVATRIRNARHTVRVKLLDRRLSAQRRGAAGGAAAAGDPSATAGAAAAAAAAAGAQDPCSWQLDTFIDQCLDELGPRLHRGDEASLMSRVMRQVATKIVLDELHALADRSISAAKRIRDDGVLGLQ